MGEVRNMKSIMILGGSELQLPAIQEAKNIGIKTIVIDRNPRAIGVRHADEFYEVSTLDHCRIIELVQRLQPNGIMTAASDAPVLTISRVAHATGMEAMSIEDAMAVTNKYLMRKRLEENAIPSAQFFAVKNHQEYVDAIKHFDSLFIVKPVDNAGGRGIFLVQNQTEADIAYQHSMSFSRTGTILVEEYLDGPEVSVESLTIGGKTEIIAITDKLTSGPPYFVEIGHSIQSMLPEETKRKIEDITKQTIKAMGIISGPSHTEVKITSGGPKIVEIGARLGGGFITSDLVPLATGINVTELSIRLAIGEDITVPKGINGGAALRYVLTPKGTKGTISKVTGLESCFDIPGVHRVVEFKNIGDIVNELRSCDDRIACVIAKGISAKDAVATCQEALSCLEIQVD